MSQAKGYPHKQPFCVGPKPNKIKKNSWWSHPPYHNSGTRSNRKQSETN